jgi:hypothetical protein
MKKKIFKNFENAVKTIKQISKDWGHTAAPVYLINVTMNKIRIDVDELSGAAKEVGLQYNRVIETFKQTAENLAKQHESKYVSFNTLDAMLKTVKESFIKGETEEKQKS